MKLIGHGVDMVEVARVSCLLGEGDEFEMAWFTAAERERALQEPDKMAFYAGRCAAKEAVVKALGTGFTEEVTHKDIEIQKQESGAPKVVLSGGALAAAQERGIDRWLLSISHTTQYALASALGMQDGDDST